MPVYLPSNNKVALIQGLAGVECAAVACAFKQMSGAGIWVRAPLFSPNVPDDSALGASRNDEQFCAS
jgi:hypothetical protein